MKHPIRLLFLLVSSLATLTSHGVVPAPASATQPTPRTPPPGFSALWNGRDLAGWWGAGTEDPRAYMALPAVDFAAKRAASLADIQRHWSVRDGEL
ncbi:MAG: hypothetical protein WCP45_17920, partial [Verrucomicrobiota bacterium]